MFVPKDYDKRVLAQIADITSNDDGHPSRLELTDHRCSIGASSVALAALEAGGAHAHKVCRTRVRPEFLVEPGEGGHRPVLVLARTAVSR